jgi:hypothetical protein
MPSSSTTLKQGDNLPGRGKSNKTRILDAIRAHSILGLAEDATKDATEEAFFGHVAVRAFNIDDPSSAMLLKVLLDKGWASLKPSLDPVEFEFPMNGSPAERAFAVVDAISKGGLAPDVGAMIVGIVKDAIVIEESTVLKAEIEKIKLILEG